MSSIYLTSVGSGHKSKHNKQAIKERISKVLWLKS